MNLLEILKKFLYKNLKFKSPVLLAYSGGVDSSSLLDLLLKCKKDISLDLHVVHINHGWRQASETEANIIKEKMKKLNICFHYKKVKMDSNKNLENESRHKRIDFFKFLYKKYSYQALILAHQKDDLAETVLKRVLEGANIYSLTSMQEVAKFQNMTVWRPLLQVSRKNIENYNMLNNIEVFQDKTNEDIKYLRAKMRKEIFPYLKKSFNKEITNNLASLSSYSLEINNYLEKKTKAHFENLYENLFGVCVNLNNVKDLIEIKYIIKKIVVSRDIEVSRDILTLLGNWILEKKPNLRIKLKKANIYADRGYFFILKSSYKLFNDKILLTNKALSFGSWKINIKKCDYHKNNSSWKHVFHNQINIYVPEDKYFIHYPVQDKKLKKIWENNKVPSFLRRLIPVISNGSRDVYEFLSGRKIMLNNRRNVLQITLKLK